MSSKHPLFRHPLRSLRGYNNRIHGPLTAFAGGLVASLLCASSAQAQIEYDFDASGLQGWSESNPIRGGDFGGELRHLSSGGNPSGCMMAVDSEPGRGSLAARAPGTLSGDLRRFKELSWDVWLPAGSTLSTSVLIEGQDNTLYRSVNQRTSAEPIQSWFEKSVDFTSPSTWTRVRGDSAFSQVVQNARALYIELDTTTQLGSEARVDNVRALDSGEEPDLDPESQLCPQNGFANFAPEDLERVITFGDSFSAGTGIYSRGSRYDNARSLREIHSTPGAKIAEEFRATNTNIACQNDTIAKIRRQIDQMSFPDLGDGVLILITAGGNDIRTRRGKNWPRVIGNCLLPGLKGCHKRKRNRIRCPAPQAFAARNRAERFHQGRIVVVDHVGRTLNQRLAVTRPICARGLLRLDLDVIHGFA